jgi:hypothetical protein
MDIPKTLGVTRRCISCRTYGSRIPDEKVKKQLRAFFKENLRDPFDNALGVERIDTTEAERVERPSILAFPR